MSISFLKTFILIFLLDSFVESQLSGCHNSPCQNGARCIDQPSTFYGYSCICVQPWTGVNCEQSRNGAGIIQGGGGYNSDNQYNNRNPNNNLGFNNPNNYPYNNNNQPGSNVIINGGNNPNQYPNSNQGGSNVYIGGNNPNNFPFNQNAGGSNIFIGNTNRGCSSGFGAASPCLNGGFCISGIGTSYTCRCNRGFYGIRCESYYRTSKSALLGIILGTILPFCAITIIVSTIIYCCCCRR